MDGFISLEGLVSKVSCKRYVHASADTSPTSISVGSTTSGLGQSSWKDVNSFPIERGDLHQAVSKRFARSRFSALTQDAIMEQEGHFRELSDGFLFPPRSSRQHSDTLHEDQSGTLCTC